MLVNAYRMKDQTDCPHRVTFYAPGDNLEMQPTGLGGVPPAYSAPSIPEKSKRPLSHVEEPYPLWMERPLRPLHLSRYASYDQTCDGAV